MPSSGWPRASPRSHVACVPAWGAGSASGEAVHCAVVFRSTPRRRVIGVLSLALSACSRVASTTHPALLATPPPAGAPGEAAPIPTARPDQRPLILATTTSTQDSGLLDVLVPLFEQQTGYQVKTVSVGTGAALALAARGEADVVLVHAPDAEQQWMAQGYGTERIVVMHNDFLVAGPARRPGQSAGRAVRARRLAEGLPGRRHVDQP